MARRTSTRPVRTDRAEAPVEPRHTEWVSWPVVDDCVLESERTCVVHLADPQLAVEGRGRRVRGKEGQQIGQWARIRTRGRICAEQARADVTEKIDQLERYAERS